MDCEGEGDVAARHFADFHLCDLVGRRRGGRSCIDGGGEDGGDHESDRAKHIGGVASVWRVARLKKLLRDGEVAN